MKPPGASKRADKQALGRWGEDQAASYLERQGCLVVSRNVRTPYGEIDLVARQDGMLVFVEVKTRSSSYGGFPESAVTPIKEEHLAAAIDEYLAASGEAHLEWRVDVIAVTGRPGAAEPEIVWFKDALG